MKHPSGNGWDAMLAGGPWLSVKELRAMTNEELTEIQRFPKLACVGVNSSRARREARRRAAR